MKNIKIMEKDRFGPGDIKEVIEMLTYKDAPLIHDKVPQCDSKQNLKNI